MKKNKERKSIDTVIEEGLKKVNDFVSNAALKIDIHLDKNGRGQGKRGAKRQGTVFDSAEAFDETWPGDGKEPKAEVQATKKERVAVFDTGDLVLLVLGIILLPIWIVIGILYAVGPLGYALTRLLSALSMSVYAITQAFGGQDSESHRVKKIWNDVGKEWAVVGRRVWISVAAFSKPFGLSKLFTHAGRSYEAFRSRYDSYVTAPADAANTPESFRARYHVVDQLPSGGSTARVYVVRPVGGPAQDLRVLKYFDLSTGAHLESLVREENAVKLSRRLNLISDSKMDEHSFWYVMPYYKGATMTRAVLDQFDAKAPSIEGYERRALGWVHQLLQVIAQYHDAGILHKDIKPDNLIVRDEFIYLVDIGLLTELASDQQLTTHGTEYFRDPEMVKLALKGEKVRDVSAHKFDIYSIGAVLFFLFDGEFPTNGQLSRMSRKSPRAVQMIVSKAMGPLEKRYRDARQMLADLDYLCWAESRGELSEVRPTDLPSFRGQDDEAIPAEAFDRNSTMSLRTSYYPPVYAGGSAKAFADDRPISGTMSALLVLLILCFTAIVLVGLTTHDFNSQSQTNAESKAAGAPVAAPLANESGLVNTRSAVAASALASIRERYETRGNYLLPLQDKEERLDGTMTDALQQISTDIAALVTSIEHENFWPQAPRPAVVVRVAQGSGEVAKRFANKLSAAMVANFIGREIQVKGIDEDDLANKWLEVETLPIDEVSHRLAMQILLANLAAPKKVGNYARFPGGELPVYVVVNDFGDVRVFYPGAKLDYFVPIAKE